jgi:hypothetical protein
MSISYDDFNKQIKGLFVKFIHIDDTSQYYGFNYKIGENIDQLPFDPTNTCQKGENKQKKYVNWMSN